MRINNNGQGFLRSNLEGDLQYDSFVPAPLSQVASSIELDAANVRSLSTCSRKIGELEGMLRFVPNASMYLAMYVRKEALLSAQIEGTQCTFDDILNPDNTAFIQKEVSDVVAYVRAAEYAMERIEELPLCTRLLREIHELLLQGTRGEVRNPGQVRASQNWIGPAGCTLRNAAYAPPNVDDMAEALGEMERFANGASDVDPIVKAALIHYQFETIHPFLDGNGRLGRLLITLSLVNDRALSGMVFYPSYQLKLHRSEYYSKLMNVRANGAYSEWIGFFCACLTASAEDAIQSLELLVGLKNENTRLINEKLGRAAHNGQRLLELLEENPIVEVNFIAEKLSLARTTASKLVDEFVNLGILTQRESAKKRYRTFMYTRYLEILRQGSDPL